MPTNRDETLMERCLRLEAELAQVKADSEKLMSLLSHWENIIKRDREQLAANMAKALNTSPVPEAVIDDAAKFLAESFDYPWEHMPDQGKEDMRNKVRSLHFYITASLVPPGQDAKG